MADDAGSMLVRSGMIGDAHLLIARQAQASRGGTIAEHLVLGDFVDDEELTRFFQSRLMVPRVSPNALAKISQRAVAKIPGDMAAEFRLIPVAVDNQQNLTVAMSDPSNTHAVDEIAFFTSLYVVRAVATQRQIAWALAHYYGVVTPLGATLMESEDTDEAADVNSAPAAPAPSPQPSHLDGAIADAKAAAPRRMPRGVTAEVKAMRHRRLPPITSPPINAPRHPPPEPEPPAPSVAAAPEPETPPPADTDAAPSATRAREETKPTGPVRTIIADDPGTPPELFDRAGEVSAPDHHTERQMDELPAIILADDQLTADDAPKDTEAEAAAPSSPALPAADATPAVVMGDFGSEPQDSEPLLLEHPKDPSDDDGVPTAVEDEDSAVVVLDKPKRKRRRTPKHTQLGLGALSASTLDKLTTGKAAFAAPIDRTTKVAVPPVDPLADVAIIHDRPIRDAPASAARPKPEPPVETVAAPVSTPIRERSSGPPPATRRARTGDPVAPKRPSSAHPPAVVNHETTDGVPTAVIEDTTTTVTEVAASGAGGVDDSTGQFHRVRPSSRDIDDGWGPPGTTIPPQYLGAMPETYDDLDTGGSIPIDVEFDDDSAPAALPSMPPQPPDPEPAPQPPTAAEDPAAMVKALEQASLRLVETLRALEHAEDRNAIVDTLLAHLLASHERVAFFAVRGGQVKSWKLRTSTVDFEDHHRGAAPLDVASTLQDIVRSRLPYRGPVKDNVLRRFLEDAVGRAPTELIAVPVPVRERVVGILYGDSPRGRVFEEHAAAVSRAAGLALERILKARKR